MHKFYLIMQLIEYQPFATNPIRRDKIQRLFLCYNNLIKKRFFQSNLFAKFVVSINIIILYDE